MPVKEEFSDKFEDLILYGKIVFYDEGFIFVDNKLNAVVIPYTLVKCITFFRNEKKEYCMDVEVQDTETLKAKNLFPANMICQNRLYLQVNQ